MPRSDRGTGPWWQSRAASRVRRTLGIGSVVVGWELYARISDNRLVPPVGDVLAALGEIAQSGDLWFHARLTLARGFTGLAIALVVGMSVGFVMARVRLVNLVLDPLLAATYPIPKLALYPVFILSLGLGGPSKVALVALECFYPIAYNTYAGARQLDRNLIWFARNAGAGRFATFRSVLMPAALPSVLTGLRIAGPLMLVVMVVLELIGESRGLGFLISDARANFWSAGLFAVVFVLGVIGFVLDRMLVLITRVVVFWERGAAL